MEFGAWKLLGTCLELTWRLDLGLGTYVELGTWNVLRTYLKLKI
jgi:hypothetical protein